MRLDESNSTICTRCNGVGGWAGWPGYTCFGCNGQGRLLITDEKKPRARRSKAPAFGSLCIKCGNAVHGVMTYDERGPWHADPSQCRA